MRHLLQPLVLWATLVLASPTVARAQAFPAPPTPEQAVQVRDAISAMKADERGPYQRIRWYCADGTVHAPPNSPCRERGGGVQHAQHSQAAQRLAQLDFHVGTILQATTYDDFEDAANAGYRLREMVLERYLFSVDDGWVMRRARYYRGALQIENEERSGRELLARRFSDAGWLRSNFLLATRLTAALPHGGVGAERTVDRIRNTALEISNVDSGFMRLRIKIHSIPSKDDVGAVERYLEQRAHTPEVRQRLVQLRDDLRAHYDPERALASLAAYEGRFGADLGLSLQERAFALAEELERGSPTRSRAEALGRVDQYVALAYAAGFLSIRERQAIGEEIDRILAQRETTALSFKGSLGYISRSLDWARGSVRGTFAPVLDRYAAVEPAAAGLPDAILRGSVLLPLSRMLDALQTDADAVLGAAHSVFGVAEGSGIRGLNPGVAMGTLRVLEPGHHDDVEAETIYVLPETPPELKPVAGVLTMAAGNLLSHVQLLARNLGIPNATLAPDLLPRLRQADGREVFYAVSPLGRVILAWPDQLGPSELALVEAGQPGRVERHRLDTSRLRLDVRSPIPLSELRAGDSGVLVGPKAANLGQLAADFPGRVSHALALPLGMFFLHADRTYRESKRTVLGELRAAYESSARMRAEGRSEGEIDAFMLERLAWVRDAIQGLEWIPESRRQVVAATNDMLGGDLSRGVFIRSDTNVEDLPEFSGA